MRLIAVPALLCLTLAAEMSVARAADDVIINGLHCNQFCQSWLGVGGKPHEPSSFAAPLQARREVRPALDLPSVQARRAEPVVITSLSQPSRATTSDLASSFPSSLENASRDPLYRIGTMPKAPATRQRAVLTASREVAPMAIEAPAPRSAPDIPSRTVPFVSAPPAIIHTEPASVSVGRAPDADPGVENKPLPAAHSHEHGTFLQREASYEVGEPLPAPDDERSAPQQRAVRRTAPSHSDLRMEPGLTTLPRLDDVVAVHGTIMIETPEDKALARRQMADLIKATTRPKQFKDGFIGQPSTEADANKADSHN